MQCIYHASQALSHSIPNAHFAELISQMLDLPWATLMLAFGPTEYSAMLQMMMMMMMMMMILFRLIGLLTLLHAQLTPPFCYLVMR